MPFNPYRIEAICGAHVNYMPQEDSMITVKTKLDKKENMCTGCTFTIDQSTGRITLKNTDKKRDCLIKDPILLIIWLIEVRRPQILP